MVRRRQLAASDRLAIEAGEGRCTHRALALRSAAVARALLGPRRSLDGARVALLARPSVAWAAGFFGVIEAGGVVVPMSPLHPDAELRYIAADAAVEALLVDDAHQERASALGVRLVVLDDHSEGAAARSGEEGVAGLPVCAPGDGALMLYTSGTTGKPKGAVLTHGNLDAQTRLLGDAWGLSEEDRLLHALPLHHMHGVVIALLTTLQAGGAAELLPRFDAAQVWEGFARATVWMAVPTMYHRLLDAFEQAPEETRRRWATLARGLRLATSGSAALPATLANRWEAIAGQIPLERFGMTELGVALSNPLGEGRRVGSVGRPLPGVEVQVVDEAGAPVGLAVAGELVARGPTVFSGYFGREEATRGAFRGGWFLTGDTGVMDADGYVRILGRTSVDILKSGGYKLSALEIEEVLREHPSVGEVAVVGLPDEAWGERVVAAVVPRGGLTQPVMAEALRDFCRGRMAPYKVPRQVVLLDELPRNALGKVVKRALMERLQGAG